MSSHGSFEITNSYTGKSQGHNGESFLGYGALTFDMDYARWLRAALNAHASDDYLKHIMDSIMAHYYEAFSGCSSQGRRFSRAVRNVEEHC